MNDERLIIKLFEDGDRALMTADVDELQRIYSDDYVQSDESGVLSTRTDLIRNLASGRIRFLSMQSTGRRVRLFGDFAIVHGSEEDEVLRDQQRFSMRYVYMDVVIRRQGRWRILGSQLARPLDGRPGTRQPRC